MSIRGKRFAVLHYIKHQFGNGGLAAVKLEDCNQYPVCKKVVGPDGEIIVYWDESTQTVKEITIVNYR